MIASKYIDAPEILGISLNTNVTSAVIQCSGTVVLQTNQSSMALSLQLLIAYLSYNEGVINPS